MAAENPYVVEDVRNGIMSGALGALLLEAAEPAYLPPPATDEERLARLCSGAEFPFNDAEFVRIMYDLARQLLGNVVGHEAGTYDLVVGDEISGMIPAVFVWCVVSARRNKEGKPPADLAFMNGGYGGQIPAGTFPPPQEATGRALIVTEAMRTGASMHSMRGAVAENRPGCDIDILTLAGNDPYRTANRRTYGPPDPTFDVVKRTLWHNHGLLGRIKGEDALHSRRDPSTYDPARVARVFADTVRLAAGIYDMLEPAAAS